jgi:hypothetical protein
MWSIGTKLAMMAIAAWCGFASMATAAGASTPTITAAAPDPFVEGGSGTLTLTRKWQSGTPSDTVLQLSSASSQHGLGQGPGQLAASLPVGNDCTLSAAAGKVAFGLPTGTAATTKSQVCAISLEAVDDAMPSQDWDVGVGMALATDDDSQAVLPSGPARVQVWDNDPTYAFAGHPSDFDEGDPITLTVVKTGGLHFSTNVPYTIKYAGSSATTSGTLSFDNSNPASLTVPNPEDASYGGDQKVTVTFTGAVTSAGSNTATFTIHDDDSIVSMASAVMNVARGDATADVIVTRSGDVDKVTAVRWAITPGTATVDQDYSPPTSGTVTFDDGDTAIPIRLAFPSGSASQARTFTVQLVGITKNSPGTAKIVAPNSTSVTIGPTPPVVIAPPTPPPTITTPVDPPVISAGDPTAALSATIQALTEPKGKALPYLALPGAGKTIYLRVKITNTSSQAMSGAYALKLTAAGVKLQGADARGDTAALAIDKLEPGQSITKTVAAKTTKATKATISIGSDGTIPVTGSPLRLKQASYAIKLDTPTPVVHSKDSKVDRVTTFSGTYAAPTCAGKLALRYRAPDTLSRVARIQLHLTATAGGCAFAGRIRWTKGVFGYSRLIVQVDDGHRSSNIVTLRVNR